MTLVTSTPGACSLSAVLNPRKEKERPSAKWEVPFHPFFFPLDFVLFRSGLDLVLMCHGGVVLLFGRAECGGGSAVGLVVSLVFHFARAFFWRMYGVHTAYPLAPGMAHERWLGNGPFDDGPLGAP